MAWAYTFSSLSVVMEIKNGSLVIAWGYCKVFSQLSLGGRGHLERALVAWDESVQSLNLVAVVAGCLLRLNWFVGSWMVDSIILIDETLLHSGYC